MSETFVQQSRFEDHVDDFNKLEVRVGLIDKELGTKVSWVVFWSIVLLLVGIAGTTFGVLYSAVKDVQKTGSETQNNVSYIKGLLDNSTITSE